MGGLVLPDLGQAVATLVTGIFLIIVAKINRGTPPAADKAGPGLRWQQLVDQMEAWTDRRLDERDEQIRRLDTRVTTLESRYRAAPDFIRRVIRRHPDTAEDVPTKIRDDLDL